MNYFIYSSHHSHLRYSQYNTATHIIYSTSTVAYTSKFQLAELLTYLLATFY